MTAETARIYGVVVTRDRVELLRECVAGLKAQTRPPDCVIVIDNESSDGTAEWLAGQDVTSFRQANTGGAAGFHRGISEAYTAGADWIWVMDDDSIAEPTALERLIASAPFGDPETGFLCSLVLWTDGQVHKMNALPPAIPTTWTNRVVRDRVMPVKRGTFVGMLIARRAVAAVGLPFRQFEIWGDDTEYSMRILRKMNGVQVLDSIVVHKTPENSGSYDFPVPKKVYWKWLRGLRNDLYIARKIPNYYERLAIGGGLVACVLKRVCLGQAPVASLWWLAKGFVFRPKVEFPVAPPQR
jgi:rhamnopyranosyl-N-acetylglucosaminyl-diphospho-decaprenol beta-1,3/1,4-galactofuranosyltransferase